jgi:hypothetical protein
MRYDNDRHGARGPERDGARPEDSVLKRLSREERMRLAIDSWEPSLLRRLLNTKPAGAAKSSDR